MITTSATGNGHNKDIDDNNGDDQGNATDNENVMIIKVKILIQ